MIPVLCELNFNASTVLLFLCREPTEIVSFPLVMVRSETRRLVKTRRPASSVRMKNIKRVHVDTLMLRRRGSVLCLISQ